jgi:hypothetical protein
MDRWPTVGIVLVVVAVAAMITGIVVLLVKMVRIRSLLRSADVPGASKVAFWGSIIYLVCPVDLLPDPILLDDIGFLLLALRSLKNTARQAGLAVDPQDGFLPADAPGAGPVRRNR